MLALAVMTLSLTSVLAETPNFKCSYQGEDLVSFSPVYDGQISLDMFDAQEVSSAIYNTRTDDCNEGVYLKEVKMLNYRYDKAELKVFCRIDSSPGKTLTLDLDCRETYLN